MAILLMATADDPNQGYFVAATVFERSTTYARTGTYSYKSAASGAGQFIFSNSSSTLYARQACYADGSFNAGHMRLDFVDNVYIRFNQSSITIFRGSWGGTLISTTSYVFPPNQWVVIEVKIYFHASAGTITIKINGVTIVDVSGLNTTGGIPTQMILGQYNTTGTNIYHDDIMVRDDDWCGLGGLYVLTPNGQGSYTDWTGTYADPYIEADAGVAGTKESFTHSGLPANAIQCSGVCVSVNAELIGSGYGAVAPFIDPLAIPAGTPIAKGARRVTSYASGPYTPSEVNALEIGVASA